jgi:hypothetical protein
VGPDKLCRLLGFEARHRPLLGRLLIGVGLTVLMGTACSVLADLFEGGTEGGDVHGFGDAVFVTAVQLLDGLVLGGEPGDRG